MNHQYLTIVDIAEPAAFALRGPVPHGQTELSPGRPQQDDPLCEGALHVCLVEAAARED